MILRFDKAFRVGARVQVTSTEDGFHPDHLKRQAIIAVMNIGELVGIAEPTHHILFQGDIGTDNYWYCRQRNLKLI